MEERLTRLNKAAKGLVPRDTQLYAAAMEPLAYKAAKDLVAAASIRLGQAYDQAWYDVGMQHKHVASMFTSAWFMGPGKTPEPASPSSPTRVAGEPGASKQHVQGNAGAPAASQTLPTVYERLAALADTTGRFIAGTVEHAFPEDASLEHDRCTSPEPPGQVQPMLSAPALDRATLTAQQHHEADQVVLDGSLCGLPRAHDPALLGSPKSQARACADADAGAGGKEQASQPQHRQEFLEEAAPNRGMSPSEQSKERARQAYAQRQELKSAKTSPAPKSPTARADAGSARPVSQQGKIVRQTAPNRGIAASKQSKQRARQAAFRQP